MDLVNAREGWSGPDAIEMAVPAPARDFSDPPGWPKERAWTYFVNNVDLIRANHAALEAGQKLDYDMLNVILADGVLALVDRGGVEGLRGHRESRETEKRIETLTAVYGCRDHNPGTTFIRDTVQRVFFFFAKYVDYRVGDPAYPDATPGTFQIRECLGHECRKLFIRSPDTPIYCCDGCARSDHGGEG